MPAELSTGGTRSLRNFLGELVWRHFFKDVRLEEPQVATYVAAVLADFVRTESLHRIRNVQGKPLEDVGEMLVESNPLLEAASFDREREVRKHVGDYTLFMTGLFPENVARIQKTRRPPWMLLLISCKPVRSPTQLSPHSISSNTKKKHRCFSDFRRILSSASLDSTSSARFGRISARIVSAIQTGFGWLPGLRTTYSGKFPVGRVLPWRSHPPAVIVHSPLPARCRCRRRSKG